MPQKPYILLVDDDAKDRAYFVAGFQKNHPDIQVEEANGADQAIACLQGQLPDRLPALIIIDYDMPYMTGADLLRHLAPIAALMSIPKVVWSHSTRYSSQCMALGASDIILKPVNLEEMDKIADRLVRIMHHG